MSILMGVGMLRLILVISLGLSGPFALAQQSSPHNSSATTWAQQVCKQSPGEYCLLANAWHWFRKVDFVVDPSLKAVKYGTYGWMTALVARAWVGDTPEVQFLATVSRAATRAGIILIGGGVVVAAMATIASSAGFLFSMVSPAGDANDGSIAYCRSLLAPYKSPEGLDKLRNLPPEEFKKLLPCIPEDSELSGFLLNGQHNGEIIQKGLP